MKSLPFFNLTNAYFLMLPLLFNSADGDKLTKEYFVLRFDDGSEAFDPKLD